NPRRWKCTKLIRPTAEHMFMWGHHEEDHTVKEMIRLRMTKEGRTVEIQRMEYDVAGVCFDNMRQCIVTMECTENQMWWRSLQIDYNFKDPAKETRWTLLAKHKAAEDHLSGIAITDAAYLWCATKTGFTCYSLEGKNLSNIRLGGCVRNYFKENTSAVCYVTTMDEGSTELLGFGYVREHTKKKETKVPIHIIQAMSYWICIEEHLVTITGDCTIKREQICKMRRKLMLV
ncbi:MAG: hypothetical protein HRU26_15655, partial [Psychroserpens sp.]|nr:hypothetical protein [Psychroserpens sp.]